MFVTVKRDLYADLLRIEERGKKNAKESSLLNRLMKRQYSKSKELAEAEEEARREKKGLWLDKSPEPPWEFRKMEREKHGKK